MKLETKYKGNSGTTKWKYLLERPEQFEEGYPEQKLLSLLEELFRLETKVGKFLFYLKPESFNLDEQDAYNLNHVKWQLDAVREESDKPWTFKEKEE